MNISLLIDDRTQKGQAWLEESLDTAGMQEFLRVEVSTWLALRAAERFETEGDAASGKWAALAPSTVAIRAASGFPGPHPINVREGELRDWLTSRADPNVTSSSGMHHMQWPGRAASPLMRKFEGAQAGVGNAPPRPVAALDSTDKFGIKGLLNAWLRGRSVLYR